MKDLGSRLHRHRWGILVFWLAIILIASVGARRVESVLLGGSGSIPGSASSRVDATLYRDFDNPFTKAVLVTFRSDQHPVDSDPFRMIVEKTARRLKETKYVRQVMTSYDAPDQNMKSPDGKATAMLVGLDARDVKEEERRLPTIRKALAPLKEEGLKAGVTIASTGRSALMVDLNAFNAQDSAKAESRAIPLTLLILLLAFGSLTAAGVPLFMGIASTTVTLGITFLLGQFLELSNLTQNIATMLGLAVGIDYSLLMVNRFREAIRTKPLVEALEETIRTSGKAVCYSGMAVMIGLCGLFFTPIFETRSVGLGGVLVVLVSVLAAVTLVPALLAIFGKRIDGRFRKKTKNEKNESTKNLWRGWAHFLMDRPVPALLAALLLAGILAWPATRSHFGFPDQKWFPQAMEARQGLDVLATMNQGWSIMPIYLVVSSPEPIHHSLGKLIRLSNALHGEGIVNQVYSPVDLKPGVSPLAYAMLYSDLDAALRTYPQIKTLFLSHDHRKALFQITLKNEATLEEAQHFVRKLAEVKIKGLTLQVGGQLVFYNDYDEVMNQCFPWVIGFVLAATFLVLAFAYRSLLLPLKAILMNLLSVGAGYGAMVAVFLLGWGKELVGLTETASGIPQSIPLILFCVIFGLSMDYEVFLLSRIKEAYDETGDNKEATAEGLAATGGIITSAALIMVVVFGAFSWAEMILIKMLGLGLAVAVLVDASLIRVLAVPAFMRIAGKWNWFPGDRRP